MDSPPPPPPAPPYQPQPGQAWPPPPQVPWTPMPQQPPVKRRRNFVPLIVLVVVVGLIAGAFFLFRDRISGDVNDLRAGDCIDIPSDQTSVTDVQHQPCTTPHDAEIFFNATDSTNGAFPGTDHFKALAQAQCVPAATSYLGHDFNNDQVLDIGYFRPSEASWGNGDRIVTCYLYRIDQTKLSAPVHGGTAS